MMKKNEAKKMLKKVSKSATRSINGISKDLSKRFAKMKMMKLSVR